jgi:cystathionine gamma-lyase
VASLEVGGACAIAFSSGGAATATMIQSLGVNVHILSVKDVCRDTFRYMTEVAKTSQGLETTFLEMESATTEEITIHIRPNTEVSTSPQR